MNNLQLKSSLVSVSWLSKHLDNEKLIILDATLPKAVGNGNGVSKDRIPGARFFDIKHVFSDTSAPFPNTRISASLFSDKARNLGIDNDSTIIVYDDHGIYSCARAWWMFRSMGHVNVAVLDGGLPAWKQMGLPTEEKSTEIYTKGNFKGTYDSNYFKDSPDVLENLDNEKEVVIDARARDRYEGAVEEPRKGLRSGHIPNSYNIPYSDLLQDGKMKQVPEMKKLMEKLLSKDKNVTFSCGSGITACVLALGAELSGYKHLSVYDGSWTEWGSLESLPISTGKDS